MPSPQRLRARVERIDEHSPDLRTYVLVPERPAPTFRPGQFLHLAIDPYDPSQHWPESRAFSICSSPATRDRLRITVSRKGVFTSRVFGQVAVGSSVWLKLPFGSFTPQAPAGGAVVLLAGGTGITPFVSFIEALAGRGASDRVDVHYAARSPELLIYRECLEQCRKNLSGLSVSYYVEEGALGPEMKSGRMDVEEIWSGLGPTDRARFYISGPPAMIEAVRGALGALGATPDMIVTDEWS